MSQNDSKPSSTSDVVGRVQSFVALASAVIGVIAAAQAFSSKNAADQSAKEAEQFKRSLEIQANARAEMELQAKYDVVAYEAVVNVLQIDRKQMPADAISKRERAVMALVLRTATESMKASLLEVLQSGATSQGKEAAREISEFLRSGAAVSSAAPPAAEPAKAAVAAKAAPAGGTAGLAALQGYRVDIFYCERDSRDDAAAKGAADRLREELSAVTSGRSLNVRWQTKKLPELVNAAPNYNIHNNEIRFNPLDQENAASSALKEIADAAPSMRAERKTFALRTVTKRTPEYLSLFMCGA